MNTFFLLVLNGYLFATTIGAPLDDVCKQALDQAYCLSTFGSSPVTKIADLTLLAEIAIIQAKANGASFKSNVEACVILAWNSGLKAILEQCDSYYDNALYAIRSMADELNNKQYFDLSLLASVVVDSATRCETLFQYPYRSPMTSDNKSFRLLGNIIQVIVNHLISEAREIS